jgi:hypothetical protein
LGTTDGVAAGCPADGGRVEGVDDVLGIALGFPGAAIFPASESGFSWVETAAWRRAAISSSTVLRLVLASTPRARNRSSTSLVLRFSCLASCPTLIFAI